MNENMVCDMLAQKERMLLTQGQVALEIAMARAEAVERWKECPAFTEEENRKYLVEVERKEFELANLRELYLDMCVTIENAMRELRAIRESAHV